MENTVKRIVCDKPVIDSYLMKAKVDFQMYGVGKVIKKGTHWAEWAPHGIDYDPLEKDLYGDKLSKYIELVLIKEIPESKKTRIFLGEMYGDICPGDSFCTPLNIR